MTRNVGNASMRIIGSVNSLWPLMSVRWLVGRSGCHNFPNGQEATLPCSCRNTRFLLCFFSQCCCTNIIWAKTQHQVLFLFLWVLMGWLSKKYIATVFFVVKVLLCIPCLEFYLLEYSRLHKFEPKHYHVQVFHNYCTIRIHDWPPIQQLPLASLLKQ